MTSKDTFQILGIESSCDETAAAVVTHDFEVKSSVISSQFDDHREFGGVVPEIASRAHIRDIVPIVEKALTEAKVTLQDVDAIAVTQGPGLIGALLVGCNFAQNLSYSMGIPLIGVHHIQGHLFSALMGHKDVQFPCVGLVASGGHSHLYSIDKDLNIQQIGRTQDDAAGEAFDKVAKVLGLGFPGGPALEKHALHGNPKAIAFPRSKMPGLDFSFSGIKTSVAYHVRDHKDHPDFSSQDVAASFQAAMADMLCHKAFKACKQLSAKTLMLVGGVSQNLHLRNQFLEQSRENSVLFIAPAPGLCTDNAAMIAAAAIPRFKKQQFEDLSFGAKSTIRLG